MMINIVYHSESAFIYTIEDWEKLRKDFRCIGQLFGRFKHKDVLPLHLQPEEALLLIDKQVGRLISCEEKVRTKEELEQFRKKLFEASKEYYKKRRLKQLQQYAPKIVAGKRKRGDMRSEDEIIQGELDKFKIDEKKVIWPIFLHNFDFDSAALVDPQVLWKQTTSSKYATFKDLWEKNFTITPGANFGGDFLIYPGDPLLYHSHYVVRCLEEEETIYPSELVVLGRVATSVKKKGVLSYMKNGKVNYITIKWIGK